MREISSSKKEKVRTQGERKGDKRDKLKNPLWAQHGNSFAKSVHRKRKMQTDRYTDRHND